MDSSSWMGSLNSFLLYTTYPWMKTWWMPSRTDCLKVCTSIIIWTIHHTFHSFFTHLCRQIYSDITPFELVCFKYTKASVILFLPSSRSAVVVQFVFDLLQIKSSSLPVCQRVFPRKRPSWHWTFENRKFSRFNHRLFRLLLASGISVYLHKYSIYGCFWRLFETHSASKHTLIMLLPPLCSL